MIDENFKRFGFIQKHKFVERTFHFRESEDEQSGASGGYSDGTADDDSDGDGINDAEDNNNNNDDGSDDDTPSGPPGSLSDNDYKPDKPPGSLSDEQLGRGDDDNNEDNHWTPGRPPGSFDLDKYGVYQDGVYKDSINILGLEINYDVHVYLTGKPYGFAAELVADIAEGVFGATISEDMAKTVDTVAKIATLALAITSVPIAINMIATGIPALVAAGVLSLTSTITTALEFADFINTHFSVSTTASIEMSMDKDSISTLANAFKRDEMLEKAKTEQLALIINNNYYKYMAGGEIYQGVFAGGDYFDATSAPNTNFSVGEPYVMSEYARHIITPYAQFLPKNQAGTDNFSVLF